MNAVHINGLTVTYPEHSEPAVEDIMFSVEEGNITMLIGPNGSGKTTIIKSILGLIPYEGEITIFGKPLKEMYGKIGYVPQRFNFDETFPITVHEFITLSLSSFEKDEDKKEEMTHLALKDVDATELVHQKLSTLSGGQLQRVLLARALAHRPKLLLLDEPESGVDVAGEQTFYDLIQKLTKEEGLAALVSSHELDVVYSYANQVICVNRRMFCHGVPHTVLNQEMFMDLYGRDLKFYGHEH
ncbi:metal ABC transporter ATP-binding protein [candidate division WWE3 bacterium]|uniref:Metal ABC transporter ATP-binding protein n=1 Tax=candidate division WWE3 bacterium TaxID=2053526 RepID=A0A955LWK9_UNCKA|nr:metal ABC transporter ATP-binding protein [candidate division WWE3 bacterium]